MFGGRDANSIASGRNIYSLFNKRIGIRGFRDLGRLTMNQSKTEVLPRFRSDLCAGRRPELESRGEH